MLADGCFWQLVVGSKPGHRPPPYLPGDCLQNSWWRRLFPGELSGVFLKVITLFFLMYQSQCLYSHGFSSFPNFHWRRDAHGCISGVKIFAVRSAGNGEVRHKSVFPVAAGVIPVKFPAFSGAFGSGKLEQAGFSHLLLVIPALLWPVPCTFAAKPYFISWGKDSATQIRGHRVLDLTQNLFSSLVRAWFT